jgi:hypothetical protein
MTMTDEQLLAAALPLLEALIERDMLIVTIDVPAPPGHPGMATTSAVTDVIPNGLALDLHLEDDTDLIAQSARSLRGPANR